MGSGGKEGEKSPNTSSSERGTIGDAFEALWKVPVRVFMTCIVEDACAGVFMPRMVEGTCLHDMCVPKRYVSVFMTCDVGACAHNMYAISRSS